MVIVCWGSAPEDEEVINLRVDLHTSLFLETLHALLILKCLLNYCFSSGNPSGSGCTSSREGEGRQETGDLQQDRRQIIHKLQRPKEIQEIRHFVSQ